MNSQLAAMYKSHPEALCPPDAHHPVFQGRDLWSALTMKPIPKRGIEGSMNSQIPTGTVNSQIPKAFVNPMIGGSAYSQIPNAFVNETTALKLDQPVLGAVPLASVILNLNFVTRGPEGPLGGSGGGWGVCGNPQLGCQVVGNA